MNEHNLQKQGKNTKEILKTISKSKSKNKYNQKINTREQGSRAV